LVKLPRPLVLSPQLFPPASSNIDQRYAIHTSTDPTEDDQAWADAERQVREAGSGVVSVKSQLKRDRKRKAADENEEGNGDDGAVNGQTRGDDGGKKEKRDKKVKKDGGDGHRKRDGDGERSKGKKEKKRDKSSR
jgi:hypothetical protein